MATLFLLPLRPVQTVTTARPCLFVSVANKITPIFPSNSAAFHLDQEGWGQRFSAHFPFMEQIRTILFLLMGSNYFLCQKSTFLDLPSLLHIKS